MILDLLHEIDQTRRLFGEFDRVHAHAGHFSSLEIEAEDTACILLGRPVAHPAASIALDYVSRRRVRRYAIVGEADTTVWGLDAAKLRLMRKHADENVDGGPDGFPVRPTYVRTVQIFLESVESRGCVPQDVRDGLRSTALPLRAKEAAART